MDFGICNVRTTYYVMQWSLVVCIVQCAMCTQIWRFTSLCVHIILYFDSTIVIDKQITIVDFGVDCSLDSTTSELASDGGNF
jgi:hypothetical protein